jgi:hypothetical protein
MSIKSPLGDPVSALDGEGVWIITFSEGTYNVLDPDEGYTDRFETWEEARAYIEGACRAKPSYTIYDRGTMVTIYRSVDDFLNNHKLI